MSLKSTLQFSKKGYLQIDFAFSLLGLLTILFFTVTSIFTYEKQNNYLIENSIHQDLSTQICYLLSSTPGIPNNWNSTNLPVSFGLKDSNSNQLDNNKVSAFFNSNNYFNFTQIINSSHFITVSLFDVNSNTQVLKLGETPNSVEFHQISKCYLTYNNTLGALLVEVWS